MQNKIYISTSRVKRKSLGLLFHTKRITMRINKFKLDNIINFAKEDYPYIDALKRSTCKYAYACWLFFTYKIKNKSF